jgi:hypothetical protein
MYLSVASKYSTSSTGIMRILLPNRSTDEIVQLFWLRRPDLATGQTVKGFVIA